MKTCPKCGEENRDSARNCTKCGHSLPVFHKEESDKTVVSDKAAEAYRLNHSLAEEYRSRNSGYSSYSENTAGIIAVYIISFVVPIVGFIVGAGWLSDRERQGEGILAIILAIIGIAAGIFIYLMYINSFFT